MPFGIYSLENHFHSLHEIHENIPTYIHTQHKNRKIPFWKNGAVFEIIFHNVGSLRFAVKE
jgi:hypothetical protein